MTWAGFAHQKIGLFSTPNLGTSLQSVTGETRSFRAHSYISAATRPHCSHRSLDHQSFVINKENKCHETGVNKMDNASFIITPFKVLGNQLDLEATRQKP